MNPNRPNCITFLPTPGDVLVSQKDDSVLAVALRHGVELNHTCGGNGTCGTCRVIVLQGLELIGERNELEQEMSLDRGFKDDERLACQIQPYAGLVLEIPKSSKD